MKLINLLLLFSLPLFSACESPTSTTQATSPSKPPTNAKAQAAINNIMTVYKSPTCQCCSRWITHLEANGFKVKAINVKDVSPYKQKAGLTPTLASCHTGFINGYVVEGHVPASDIKRMLKEKPDIKGLTVPAMPVGTPGMEMGDRKDPYDVISFDKNGKTKVYKSYR